MNLSQTLLSYYSLPGADPGFQVRGAHLKKMRRAKGGAKIFGVFRVKNHDFTPKKSYFSNFRGGGGGGGGARNFRGISCEKSRFYAKQIIFFPILGGSARRVRPPLNPPLLYNICFANFRGGRTPRTPPLNPPLITYYIILLRIIPVPLSFTDAFGEQTGLM